MKPIGPTFADEICAAGLGGLPFSWGPDGVIEFRDDVPQETRDAVMAVYAAHDPKALPAPAPASISDGKLAALLVAKKILTQEAVDAAVAEADTPLAASKP